MTYTVNIFGDGPADYETIFLEKRYGIKPVGPDTFATSFEFPDMETAKACMDELDRFLEELSPPQHPTAEQLEEFKRAVPAK